LISLPPDFRAVVFGATGALGGAFVAALGAMPACGEAVALSRRSTPPFDLEDEASIRACAAALAPRGPFHLMIDATGALTIDGVGPEKRLDDLAAARLARAFAVNAIGPALLMKHFVPLLPTGERCIFATLSARVGSIGDNRKGGWYGYRASKAALNMLLRTAAIEACRRRPEAVFAALQPGTVRSALSAPFVAGEDALAPEASAAMLLAVLDAAPARKEALFLDHRGHAIEW
jgi:NAD(P)-dependent dehydrogenase (short-subunit alcohol dehydrogenase family)